VKIRWTESEVKFLLDNHMKYTNTELARMLNKTRHAINSKKMKLLKMDANKERSGKKNITECPICGSKRFNEVDTYYLQRTSASKGYYCMGCDKQFDGAGNLLREII